jgi:hypothetical protein
VAALSKSPVFHHQYSSITKAIANLAGDERELGRVRKLFKEQWGGVFSGVFGQLFSDGCG